MESLLFVLLPEKPQGLSDRGEHDASYEALKSEHNGVAVSEKITDAPTCASCDLPLDQPLISLEQKHCAIDYENPLDETYG